MDESAMMETSRDVSGRIAGFSQLEFTKCATDLEDEKPNWQTAADTDDVSIMHS